MPEYPSLPSVFNLFWAVAWILKVSGENRARAQCHSSRFESRLLGLNVGVPVALQDRARGIDNKTVGELTHISSGRKCIWCTPITNTEKNSTQTPLLSFLEVGKAVGWTVMVTIRSKINITTEGAINQPSKFHKCSHYKHGMKKCHTVPKSSKNHNHSTFRCTRATTCTNSKAHQSTRLNEHPEKNTTFQYSSEISLIV